MSYKNCWRTVKWCKYALFQISIQFVAKNKLYPFSVGWKKCNWTWVLIIIKNPIYARDLSTMNHAEDTRKEVSKNLIYLRVLKQLLSPLSKPFFATHKILWNPLNKALNKIFHLNRDVNLFWYHFIPVKITSGEIIFYMWSCIQEQKQTIPERLYFYFRLPSVLSLVCLFCTVASFWALFCIVCAWCTRWKYAKSLLSKLAARTRWGWNSYPKKGRQAAASSVMGRAPRRQLFAPTVGYLLCNALASAVKQVA